MALVCDPEATPYKYLASINIKATPATIMTHKPEYEIRTGAGAFFAASLRLPSWAVRRRMMHRRVGLMRAKAWPRTRCFLIGWGNPMRERKSTATIAASVPVIALTAACWGTVLVTVIWLAYRL
jgi:hypothetical protein